MTKRKADGSEAAPTPIKKEPGVQTACLKTMLLKAAKAASTPSHATSSTTAASPTQLATIDGTTLHHGAVGTSTERRTETDAPNIATDRGAAGSGSAGANGADLGGACIGEAADAGDEARPQDAPQTTEDAAEKLQLAVQLAGGDVELANKSLNLKQSERNRFKDMIQGQATSEELKSEWSALNELGHGRNKK